MISVSVIIPTHNRPDRLAALLDSLRRQDLLRSHYEVVVVDDGSVPPVSLPAAWDGPRLVVVRTEGVERSAARNAGARVSTGALLVFLDDDMVVHSDFLAAYQQADRDWPGAILVGAIRLPDRLASGPFGRFRQELERESVPQTRGLVGAPNFCAAGNMAIGRATFERLAGFEHALTSGEDQDLALRHTAAGGRIAFVPEAEAVHHDSAADLRGYCRRFEWGYREIVHFARRHSSWPDNVERGRVNGPVCLGREPLGLSLRKVGKTILGHPAPVAALFGLTAWLEQRRPSSPLLPRLYRTLLGLHIYRGYRSGLERYGLPAAGAGMTPGPLAAVPTVEIGA